MSRNVESSGNIDRSDLPLVCNADLDAPATTALDRLTRWATKALRAHVVLISLVDGHEHEIASVTSCTQEWISHSGEPKIVTRMSFSTITKTTALGSESFSRLVSPTGSRKNRPIASASARTTVPAHVPPEIGSSSSGSCALAEILSALKPSLSAERDDAADDRHAAAGDLCGTGRADGHGPRRDAAHHHAFEHRLAADGSVPDGDQGAVGQPLGHWRGRRHGVDYFSAWRLAARRLKRSTRPPVSTSFWRPV